MRDQPPPCRSPRPSRQRLGGLGQASALAAVMLDGDAAHRDLLAHCSEAGFNRNLTTGSHPGYSGIRHYAISRSPSVQRAAELKGALLITYGGSVRFRGAKRKSISFR
jgi:hypothetical protein